MHNYNMSPSISFKTSYNKSRHLTQYKSDNIVETFGVEPGVRHCGTSSFTSHQQYFYKLSKPSEKKHKQNNESLPDLRKVSQPKHQGRSNYNLDQHLSYLNKSQKNLSFLKQKIQLAQSQKMDNFARKYLDIKHSHIDKHEFKRASLLLTRLQEKTMLIKNENESDEKPIEYIKLLKLNKQFNNPLKNKIPQEKQNFELNFDDPTDDRKIHIYHCILGDLINSLQYITRNMKDYKKIFKNFNGLNLELQQLLFKQINGNQSYILKQALTSKYLLEVTLEKELISQNHSKILTSDEKFQLLQNSQLLKRLTYLNTSISQYLKNYLNQQSEIREHNKQIMQNEIFRSVQNKVFQHKTSLSNTFNLFQSPQPRLRLQQLIEKINTPYNPLSVKSLDIFKSQQLDLQ